MRAFRKPALSGPNQLALLKQRGLQVADDAHALRRLRHIGYYRLSAYMLPFQNGGTGPNRHVFRPGTTFEMVVQLYVFDRKLRLLFLDAIERIEISVRAGLSGKIAVDHGPHWYENPALFSATARHNEYLDEIDRQLQKSTDVFIAHYYRTYTSPSRPPCWMLFECMAFGTVSTTVSKLIPRNAGELVGDYGLPYVVLDSWLHAVSYVRNLCAHHARLWNRAFTIKPAQANRFKTELADTTRLYAQAVVVLVLSRAIAPDTRWAKKLAELFDEYPEVPLAPMGFPADWRERQIWREALA